MTTEMINFQTNQGITALDIEQQVANIPMNKENAIKIMVLSKTLAAREDEAKRYLLDRCAECDIYSVGQLQVQRVDGVRSSYSNADIEALKGQIKDIEKGIKEGKVEGDKVETHYTSFRVKK